MFKKVLQLGLCLAILAITASTAPASTINTSYSRIGAGGTMPAACAMAVQLIEEDCAMTGPITTDPIGCKPLYGLNGQVIGSVCRCKATTTICGIIPPNLP